MRFTDRNSASVGYPSERDEWNAFRLAVAEALAAVRRHVGAIALAVLACLAGAGAITALRPATYLGTAQILLDPRGLNVVSNEVVPTPPSSDVNDAIIETQTRFLTSDEVLRQVVVGLDLPKDAEFSTRAGPLARLRTLAGLDASKPSEPVDPVAVAVALLRRQTSFQRQGKSFVVDLSVRAGNPDKAARIATAIGQTFVADLERRRRDIVAKAREAMAATLKDQSERVVTAEDAVERYKSSINVVDSDGRVLNTARLAELNSQLLTARSASRTLAAQIAQLNGSRGAASPSAGSGTDALVSPVLSQLKINFAEVTRQQENLRATVGPRHPAAVELEAQVRSLKAAIARETARLETAVRSDHASAQIRERALEREVAKIEADTARTNGALVSLRQLEREASAQRSVYEKSLGRERELLEQESVGTTNASVVSAAKPNPDSVDLKPGLLIAAAALLGALLGMAGAVLYDNRGGRLHSAARLTSRTGLAVIGVLRPAKPARGGRPGLPSLLDADNGETARVLHRVAAAIDEAAGNGPVRLLVLSTSKGAVSSLVASNLVLAQAGRGFRALLLDGSAHAARPTSLVARANQAAMVPWTADGVPPFGLGATGTRVGADPIAAQAEGFDRVVIDGGTELDEVSLRRLASAATAIVLVAESGSVTVNQIAEMRAALMSSADKLAGVLLVAPGNRSAKAGVKRIWALPRRLPVLQSGSRQPA